MEENLEKVEEEETLTLEPEVEAEEQEEVEAPEPKTYTEEEFSKYKSDTERGVQKILREKARAEKVIDITHKVNQNEEYLVSFYDEDPEVAKIILDKYFGGKSIEDFKRDIGYEIDYNDPDTRKKYFEIESRRLIEKNIIDKSKKDFIEKLKMSKDEEKAFEESFDERRQLKSFKIDDIEKQLEKAYRDIASDTRSDELRNNKEIAKSMSKQSGNSEVVTKKKEANPFDAMFKSFESK